MTREHEGHGQTLGEFRDGVSLASRENTVETLNRQRLPWWEGCYMTLGEEGRWNVFI